MYKTPSKTVKSKSESDILEGDETKTTTNGEDGENLSKKKKKEEKKRR